ncbi:MAG TPA: VanZ family protein [Candidatus Limnocylindrales bacterium]|nr:VanZ family protein [Candidatus Limnocylindrales bacterium]
MSTSRFILLAVPLGMVIALLWSWRVRDGWWRVVVRVALAVYLAVLVGLVFFPLPLTSSPGLSLGPAPGPVPWPAPWANLTPWATIGVALRLGPDWPEFWILLGNVAAFVPLGVFIGLVRPAGRSWRRAFLICLVATVAIELVQLGVSLKLGYPYRVADIDDVIVNVFGGLLGFAAFVVANRVGRAILPARFVFWAGHAP